MEWTATDVIGVISYLLPGFLAAWVFYGLTAHPRKSPFERIVQALIFTVIIQGFTTLTRWAYEWGAQWHSFGAWTKDIALVTSLVNATILGLLFAWFANKDWFHAGLRWLGVTKRTSYPSEWFSAFNRRRRYVILHLDGNRRLYGWPYCGRTKATAVILLLLNQVGFLTITRALHFTLLNISLYQ